ncbi:hypothetical protein RF55_24008, partial [Lasius niger]
IADGRIVIADRGIALDQFAQRVWLACIQERTRQYRHGGRRIMQQAAAKAIELCGLRRISVFDSGVCRDGGQRLRFGFGINGSRGRLANGLLQHLGSSRQYSEGTAKDGE